MSPPATFHRALSYKSSMINWHVELMNASSGFYEQLLIMSFWIGVSKKSKLFSEISKCCVHLNELIKLNPVTVSWHRSNGRVWAPIPGGRSPHHEARWELGCRIKMAPIKKHKKHTQQYKQCDWIFFFLGGGRLDVIRFVILMTLYLQGFGAIDKSNIDSQCQGSWSFTVAVWPDFYLPSHSVTVAVTSSQNIKSFGPHSSKHERICSWQVGPLVCQPLSTLRTRVRFTNWAFRLQIKFMPTLESLHITIVGGGVLILRTLPNS